MNYRYAGIGSRKTPKDVCEQMTNIASILENLGFVLRSGGAVGADKAFERGAKSAKVIYRPEHVSRWHLEHAKKYHPAWSKCDDFAKRLHARNSAIILGPALDWPVKFVICWTEDGLASGGTGQGIRIAEDLNIPVYNLNREGDPEKLMKVLNFLKTKGTGK